MKKFKQFLTEGKGIFGLTCDHCGTSITQPVFHGKNMYGYSCANKILGKQTEKPSNKIQIDKIEKFTYDKGEGNYNHETDGDIKDWHEKHNGGHEIKGISAKVIYNNVRYRTDNLQVHNGNGYMPIKPVIEHIQDKLKKVKHVIKDSNGYDKESIDKVKSITKPYHNELSNYKEYKALSIPVYDKTIKNYSTPLSMDEVHKL